MDDAIMVITKQCCDDFQVHRFIKRIFKIFVTAKEEMRQTL